MTQTIIENHLLRVGASRYQDLEFRRQYPEVSPISRFGIGVLSAFMIADSVEILTTAPEEDTARHLTLRSVHGRYLIRLLDRKTDPAARDLGAHGTVIRLALRPSARLQDVAEIARNWIVVPRCEVTVQIDDEPPQQVGYESVREALAADLRIMGVSVRDEEDASGRIRIEVQERDGLAVAYAMQWSSYFKEWTFVRLPRQPRPGMERTPLFGTCVEGIRVEAGTPGYRGNPIAALADATGERAPKTNVARSGIGFTPEREEVFMDIYRVYCQHVADEMQALHEDRGFSLT
jgi:hypothetical protein